MKEIFPAKILLFGEYTIITNEQALVTPLHLYSGKLAFPGKTGDASQEMLASNQNLDKFCKYLSQLQDMGKLMQGLDLDAFSRDIENQLWFQSNIPMEYGAGSSAALVGAIATRYGMVESSLNKPGQLKRIRSVLALMESYFHGQSSGIDPLCSLLGQSLLINGEQITTVAIPDIPTSHRLFLVDSGQSGSTGPLVKEFKSDLEHPGFRKIVTEDMAVLVNSCIDRIISGSIADLGTSFHELSLLQFRNFQKMIPKHFRDIWEKCLDSGPYHLKLCGSGGGGFLLGYTANWDTTRQKLLEEGITPIALSL